MTKDKQTRIWTDRQKDKWTGGQMNINFQTDVLKGRKTKERQEQFMKTERIKNYNV